MRHNRLLTWGLPLVFLVCFNAAFFLFLGTQLTRTAWLSYAVIHAAYLLTLLGGVLAGKSKHAWVFHLSIDAVSFVYFAVVFLVGLGTILSQTDRYSVLLPVYVILTGFYFGTVLIVLWGNADTALQQQRHQEDLSFIKNGCHRLRLIFDRQQDTASAGEIERAYQLMQASPTMSNENAAVLESRIRRYIDDLERVSHEKNDAEVDRLSRSIYGLLQERNHLLS